jgi:LPS-assembly protein
LKLLVLSPPPLSRLTLALCLLGLARFGHAQAVEEVRLPPLKNSRSLTEEIPPTVRHALPTFLSGDTMSGRPELEAVVEGRDAPATLRRFGMVMRADRIEYDQAEDLAKARGNVFINRKGNTYEGPLLALKVEAFEGFFNQPRYRFLKTNAYGEADKADFVDHQHAVLHNATYSTCQRVPGPSWLPAWLLKAATVDMDEEEDVGVAKQATLTFKGLTTPEIPSISFPLSDKRKSGWLPPVFDINSVSGAQMAASYYWDIAPNRDATLTPSVMSKRGVKLDSEFRYMEPSYRGIAKLDLMPWDSLRQQVRWGAALTHAGTVNTGIASVGPVTLGLNLNRVSDDNYWSDFPRSSASLTQRLLPNTGTLTWARGDFSTTWTATKWQTLQTVASPIVPPYDRLPQLTARFARSNLGGLGVGGFDVVWEGDATQFSANKALTLQPNAARLYTRAEVSRPWQAPGWFVIPKMQLHAASYQFDAALSDGSTAANSVVPTFSLDSGLVLERNSQYFGRNFTQTLEPRAFYVHTPYRNQSLLPLYDTGAMDFNFATIYTENAFVGHDRISDNNLLTLGVTSRLLDPATGAEAVRLGIAQRLRFKDQLVTLRSTDSPVVDRVSDVLLGAAINWVPQWTVDTTVQFNQKTDLSTRGTAGVRYNPGNYRTVSAAYRFQRDISNQIDLGWQWPLNDLWGDKGHELGTGRGQGEGRWYSVGRLNYSLQDRKMVDAVVGLEYDAGCWLGRTVLSRLLTGAVSGVAATSISFQLEFVGFSRVGVNGSPLRMFKQNVPRYQYLREPQATPSPFSNYD